MENFEKYTQVFAAFIDKNNTNHEIKELLSDIKEELKTQKNPKKLKMLFNAIIGIATEVENRIKNINKNIKVAVMGCVVNGPGEAREADLGIAGGKGVGLVFKKGEVIRKVNEDELVSALMEEIEKI